MSEPASTATIVAACTLAGAAGAGGAAALQQWAAFGLDPPAMIGAIGGVVIAQVFLPVVRASTLRAFGIQCGAAMWLASLTAEVLMPTACSWLGIPIENVRLRPLVGAFVGAFAQPLLQIGWELFAARWRAVAPAKGDGNA